MEEQEEAPTLRLEILQGPREGETLEFKPGAAVRIGRVVKGNTLPIKDLGISSKHLTISTESNKWTLRDLDSSNGTVLDGSQIPPHTPFTLQHDSIIKIGELTSIHVIFVPREQQQQQERAVQPRRNPTRRGRTELAPTESVPPRGRGRPRGLKSKVQVQIQSVEENDASVVDAESERVGRPSRVTRKTNRGRSVVKEDSSVVVENLDAPEGKAQSVKEKNASVVEAKGESVGPPARVTRNGNTGGSVVRVCDDDDVPVEKLEEPKSTRNLSLIEISDSSVENSDAPVMEEPKKTRMTRNSKKVPGVTTGNVEKKTKRGVAEKRELEEEGEDLNGVKETCDGREEGNLKGDDGNLPDLKRRKRGATEKRELEKEDEDGNVVKEACDGREEGNLNGDDRNWPDLKGRERELEKEGEDGNSEKEACHENWPDLNKMTLGEWFDFLEVYLPKQIIDETEEMIDSMTQKAKRLREYIVEMQQQNGKAKMPMEE